ncbi:MAG: CGNR zinc finger domain-containing protein [Acidimicrobiia bacterium]|nr:CGNR zinc finger domain-containing protein [Acidimicrobiia bacterium]
MDFSHYTDLPVEFAAALVNTDQRAFGNGDAIGDLDGLLVFLAEYAELWEGETENPSRSHVAPVQQLRDEIRQVFSAPDEATAVELLNRLLIRSHAMPRISLHGDTPHFHFETARNSLPDWLAAVAAMGLATVVIDHGVSRFGACESDSCADVFIDTSRNRSRRHCSTTCSTREHVAAHRRRKKEG